MSKRREPAGKQIKRLLEERGQKALELARKTVLEEKIESKEIKEALRHFMMEYWNDVERPGLLSMVCEAVGGKPDATTDVAVSLSIISGAADIHDDIIDESKQQHGRMTVYGKFGKDVALLVGDGLFFKGLSNLGKCSAKNPTIIDIAKDTFFELGDAESLELPLRGKLAVTPETCLKIVRKKAADVEAHTRIGAILGGGTNEEIEALGEYGRLLGMLIILKDDYVDSLEREVIQHRITNEHLPLPIIYAAQQKEAYLKLCRILKKKNITKKDSEEIIKIVEKANGYKHTKNVMKKIAECAKDCLFKISKKRELELLVNSFVSDL